MLSALYIIVIVMLTALPCHFYLIADSALYKMKINPIEAPQGVTAYLIDTDLLRLRWFAVAGADSYAVYRGNLDNDLDVQRIAVTQDTMLLDSLTFDPAAADSVLERFYEVRAILNP